MTLVIILIIVGLILIAGIAMYNGLVRANVRVQEAWSDITVQLKRRYDLIPNLVNTVKGYASHEKEVFEKVTEARSNAINENFKALQDELVDTEDKIQAARRFYNGSARDLNIKIQSFPTNIFAGMLGFKIREFFELTEAEQAAANKPVDVKF
jgi:LemA protein